MRERRDLSPRLAAVLACALLPDSAASAEVVVSHHGRLLNEDDSVVSHPALPMRFTLYSSPLEDAEVVWDSGEAACSVAVTGGYLVCHSLESPTPSLVMQFPLPECPPGWSPAPTSATVPGHVACKPVVAGLR